MIAISWVNLVCFFWDACPNEWENERGSSPRLLFLFRDSGRVVRVVWKGVGRPGPDVTVAMRPDLVLLPSRLLRLARREKVPILANLLLPSLCLLTRLGELRVVLPSSNPRLLLTQLLVLFQLAPLILAMLRRSHRSSKLLQPWVFLMCCCSKFAVASRLLLWPRPKNRRLNNGWLDWVAG